MSTAMNESLEFTNSDDYVVYSFTAEYLKILNKLNIPHCEIICKSIYYDNNVLDLFEVLSHHALVSHLPILLLVNSISSVAANTLWMKYRKNNQDMIIDIEGNMYQLKDVIN